jgi:hypothetical protein
MNKRCKRKNRRSDGIMGALDCTYFVVRDAYSECCLVIPYSKTLATSTPLPVLLCSKEWLDNNKSWKQKDSGDGPLGLGNFYNSISHVVGRVRREAMGTTMDC